MESTKAPLTETARPADADFLFLVCEWPAQRMQGRAVGEWAPAERLGPRSRLPILLGQGVGKATADAKLEVPGT